MSRTLEQVMSELAVHDAPRENLIRQKQASIPGMIEDEERGLRAQEADYFENTIMGDARRRGVGFGGIPLGERARYGSTHFLPALARNRASGREQALGLEDAILQIVANRRAQGQSIFEGERNFAEQQRQFNEQMAFNKAQAAAQARAAAAAGSFRPTIGGGVPTAPSQKLAPKSNPYEQDAFNDVYTRLQGMPSGPINPKNMNAYNAILSDYKATLASANFGNQRDKIKVQLYHQLAPQLFKNNIPAGALGNGGQLSF